MSSEFCVVTLLCYGKDNEAIEEIRCHLTNDMDVVYNPSSEAWLLGEWRETDE